MRTVRATLGAALVVASIAPSAVASHGGLHPTFNKTEAVYFHCNGPTKVYQVNWALAIGAESSFTPWNATAPSQSVQQGAGCGAIEWGGTTNVLYDAVFRGTFTGNLRDLTVKIHNLATSQVRQGTTSTLRLYAEIDGVPIFPPGAQPANGRTVTVTPVRSSTGASELFEFSITNLGFARDVLDADGNVIDVETGGVATEDGDGSMEHTLLLMIGSHGTAFGQDPAGHRADAWVWDTTEVPSGLVFNPTSLASARVAADLPDFSGG